MNNDSFTVDFLGDISFAYCDNNNQLNIDTAEQINSFLGEADYRIANLESPIVLNENSKPIDKSGPNLKIDKAYIPFLEKLHIDGYALANNHIGDYGLSGIEDTIKALQSIKKEYVGAAKGYDELCAPLKKEINGVKISIISVCENEFGVGQNMKMGGHLVMIREP